MLQRLNNFLSVVLKSVVLILLILLIPYVGVTIYGNVVSNRPAVTDTLPAMPSIKDAPFQVKLTVSGQTLLAKSYTQPAEGVYILNGFYTPADKKWIYRKGELKLDPYYWGTLTVERRVK